MGSFSRWTSRTAAGVVDLAARGGGQPDPAGHRPRRPAPWREADRGRSRHHPAGESPDRTGSALSAGAGGTAHRRAVPGTSCRRDRRRRDPRPRPDAAGARPVGDSGDHQRRVWSPDGRSAPGLARVRSHGRRPRSGGPARRPPRLPPGHLVGLGERPARSALARHRGPYDDCPGRGPARAAQPGARPPHPRRTGRRRRGPRSQPRRGCAPGPYRGHGRGAHRHLSSRGRRRDS